MSLMHQAYPPRNALDEKTRLQASDTLSLDALNHYGWAGARDLRAGARILITGVGSGDVAVQMAEQARDTAIEIVATEDSPFAIEITSERFGARGLNNATLYPVSILTLPDADLGKFDIVISTELLHRMPNPEEGAAVLRSMLADDGLLVLRLPATYGRMGVHVVQSLMAYLIKDDMPEELQIAIVREYLQSLPPTHWLAKSNRALLDEVALPDNRGIYELFIKPQTHAFTVTEIYQLLDSVGLSVTSFAGPLRAAYRPETHSKSDILNEIVADKPEYQRESIGELMHTGMIDHWVYASPQEKVPAQFDESMVIAFAPSFTAPFGNVIYSLIDGKRTAGEIAALANLPLEKVEEAYNALSAHDQAFLRHRSVPPYLNWNELQARLKA